VVQIADSHSDFTGFSILGGTKDRLFDHVDLDRMILGGIALQGFAVWVPPESEDRLCQANEQIDFLHAFIDASGGLVRLCTTCDDIAAEVPIKAVIAIESGESIDCRVDQIQMVYDKGARMMSLTWNMENDFACGCMKSGGLKPRGRDAIGELNRLHMALDVSHINEDGFWDVMEAFDAAPCASHSCVYELMPNPRNLNRAQITEIISRDGYIGVNFYPEFLKGRRASISDVLDHIEFIISCGGEDHVGFGSDFCGIQYTPDGLNSVADFQKLPAAMVLRGYPQSLILKICYGNFKRYILKFL
jgi:membrane dipeptidase